MYAAVDEEVMKSNVTNLVVGCVVLGMFAAAVILTWDYPPAANRLILLMSFIGIFLALAFVLTEIWLWKKRELPEEGRKVEDSRYTVPAGKLLVTSAWIASIAPVVYLLGFTPGISLYALVYYKVKGGRWLSSIVLGLVMAGAIYLGFVVALEVVFPRPALVPFVRW